MVVHIKKFVFSFSLILMLISSITFAESSDKYKTQILGEVQKKFTIALMEVELAMGKCYEEKKVSSLNASLFKDIKITHEEMMTALFYFSQKAILACVTEAKYKNLAYFSLKYQSTLKSFQEETELSPYIFFDSGLEERLEIRYNEISSKYRTALEKIPELSKPFDSSKVLNQVELEIYGITPKDIYY